MLIMPSGKIKRWINIGATAFLMAFFLSGAVSSGGLSIVTNGVLTFRTVGISETLLSDETKITIEAVSSPSFLITDLSEFSQGWRVVFQCEPLRSESGDILPVSHRQEGASIVRIDGQHIDPVNGPLLEGVSVDDLNSGVVVVNAYPGSGKGRYYFATNPGDFTIRIRKSPRGSKIIRAGTYRGRFTVAIIPGPGGKGSWKGTVQ